MDENDGRDGMEQETNKLLRDPELAEPIQGRAKELGWVCRRLIMWWNSSGAMWQYQRNALRYDRLSKRVC
jgi:hypothetical protein